MYIYIFIYIICTYVKSATEKNFGHIILTMVDEKCPNIGLMTQQLCNEREKTFKTSKKVIVIFSEKLQGTFHSNCPVASMQTDKSFAVRTLVYFVMDINTHFKKQTKQNKQKKKRNAKQNLSGLTATIIKKKNPK